MIAKLERTIRTTPQIKHPTQKYMGESFQDYSWIPDFEADFP